MPRRAHHDRRRPTAATIEAPTPLAGRDVRVELAGHSVRLAELRARPQRYARWFAQARRDPGHARCRCRAAGERLVIRELAGTYHLARWPQTKDNHHPACPFFSTDSAHSAAAAAGDGAHRDAITVSEHGIRIAVGYAFSTVLSDTDLDEHDEACAVEVAELLGGARPTTATITGLGLLQWLWESAGLNTWPPATDGGGEEEDADHAADDSARRRRPQPRREWVGVHAALVAVLAGLRLGDQPAPALCHVVAPYRPGRPDPAREARLAEFLRPLEQPEYIRIPGGPRRGQTRQVRHRRLLLGELKDLTATEHGHKLTLRHFPRPVFLTGEQHRHLTRRFPAAFSPRRGPTARRLLLALIEGSPQGYLRLVDAAAQLASSGYVPADSSHEVIMADRLVAAGRAFTKPLRYGGEAALPDFVLTDTDPPTIVEVFGVIGRADYEARKKIKLRHYADAGVPQISWVLPGPPPPIPAPPRQQPAAARPVPPAPCRS